MLGVGLFLALTLMEVQFLDIWNGVKSVVHMQPVRNKLTSYRPAGYVMPWGELIPLPLNYDGTALDADTLKWYAAGMEVLCEGSFRPARKERPTLDNSVYKLPPPRPTPTPKGATVQVIYTPIAEGYTPPSASMKPRQITQQMRRAECMGRHYWEIILAPETPETVYMCLNCFTETTDPEYINDMDSLHFSADPPPVVPDRDRTPDRNPDF